MDLPLLIALAIVFVIYFAPTIIAWIRDHHNVAAICVLNLLLGWTFLGWVLECLRGERRRDPA